MELMVADSKARISTLFTRCAFLRILAVLLALAAPGRVRAQSRKIELDDLQKIVNVSSPEISPDGKSIVIVVSRVNWDEDRYDSQLVLVDIATGAQRVQCIHLKAVPPSTASMQRYQVCVTKPPRDLCS